MGVIRKLSRGLAPAALILGICGGVQTAKAGAFLWISAPNWSYSAAAAASPGASFYFWALSSGANTYTWAGAFSNDGFGDAAYAFAEAAAGVGGVGAVQAVGVADPYAGVGIDYGSLVDPSNGGGFPMSAPGSNPFGSDTGYSVTTSGIMLGNEFDEELNGVDDLQAFLYTGSTDLHSLETALGDSDTSGTNVNGSTSAGDYSNISGLTSQLGGSLIPLDNLTAGLDDGTTSGLSMLPFTMNQSDVNSGDLNEVILVGEGDASSTPEPASIALIGFGMLGLGLIARKRRAS
jgi:hypothetical protein